MHLKNKKQQQKLNRLAPIQKCLPLCFPKNKLCVNLCARYKSEPTKENPVDIYLQLDGFNRSAKWSLHGVQILLGRYLPDIVSQGKVRKTRVFVDDQRPH